MTVRDSYRRIMDFHKPDDVLVWRCESIAEQAVRKWCAEEGYPAHMSGTGLLPVSGGMYTIAFNDQVPIPSFIPRYAGMRGNNVVSTDQYGSTVMCPKGYSVEPVPYIYIDGPLKTPEDWREMKKRFDPNDLRRYPAHWGEEYFDMLKTSSEPVLAGITWGPARGIKNGYMFGYDNFLYKIAEDPGLFREINEFWADYCIDLFSKFITKIVPDTVVIREDGMGYKTSSVLSPDTYSYAFAPYVKKFTDFLYKSGVKTVCYYTSGNIIPLLPALIEAGINMTSPAESAAGMDAVELRKRFPELRVIGNISKDAVMSGKRETEREVAYKMQLYCEGGYIPAIDDMIMPDMTFENVKYCHDLLYSYKIQEDI